MWHCAKLLLMTIKPSVSALSVSVSIIGVGYWLLKKEEILIKMNDYEWTGFFNNYIEMAFIYIPQH